MTLPPQLKRGQQQELDAAQVKALLTVVGIKGGDAGASAAHGAPAATGDEGSDGSDDGDDSEPNGNVIGYQSSNEHKAEAWSRMRGNFDPVVAPPTRRGKYPGAGTNRGGPRKPKGR